ncbi:unnamed protein product [Didymodactylos carnosus]|uniref:Uncharacterized protein n=1 Tax=Didymodactylos carnosus TaxID=1234261 RepID=A0A8S2DK84_9BILA|nr:unnamed protein product [Didymodactylos carnosus]CAF3692184.1 unnamed protein product [Didymodactylos carnosus]
MDFLERHNVTLFCKEKRIEFRNRREERHDPPSELLFQPPRQLNLPSSTQHHSATSVGLGKKSRNAANYILQARESIKIPPYAYVGVPVKPHRPFKDYSDHSEYDVTSMTHCPAVANGVISPCDDLFIQVANFSRSSMIIHQHQKLAYMERMNQNQVNVVNLSSTAKENLSKTEINSCIDLSQTGLDSKQKCLIKKLIESYPEVFRDKLGGTSLLKHHIQLEPNTKPVNKPPYRIAPERRKIVDKELKDMLESGTISGSNSPYASPIVLAAKKDGSLRFCVDYRRLNAATVRDAYPIPRIDDTLDSLQQAKFVSTLDLKSGYWQVEMDQESKQKTAFITHKGLFEFNVMPYGLTNGPATFQRLMDIVLAGFKWQCCLVYIDDIVIFSPTFDQHLIDLNNVLHKIREAELTLKTSKCQFCRRELKYLGHLVTPEGIKPDPSIVSSVREFPRPQKIRTLQSFLGLTGYYRRFIKNYAKIAEPLLEQLRNNKNNHLNWNAPCEEAFNLLKQILIKAPVMCIPDFDQQFILELDASDYGLGAVLAQELDRKKSVVAYASRTLTPAERKYGATEKEALAIVWATKHFRPYLEGGKVLVRSDCKALQWLKSAKDPTGRLARWAMKLSAFDLEIKHRPGTSNQNADALSRYPVEVHSPYSSNYSNEKEINSLDTAVNIWESCNILEDIKEEQKKDSKLKPIIDYLLNNTTKSNSPPSKSFRKTASQYVIINGILYKTRSRNSNEHESVPGKKNMIVIPQNRQQQILEWAHDHPTSGHSGLHKTLYRLLTRVYWPGMRRDVFKYTQACSSCQQFKYCNRPSSTPMQLHLVTEPWHTIEIDMMGPFPPTQRQKQYLLVVVDYFTRWVEMFPLRTTTATDMAIVIVNEVICRYGCPKYILSDNGPQFVAEMFTAICKDLGIKNKFTATYHPQTNMTERVNKTVKQMVAQYAEGKPNSWDKEIAKLAFSIRTSVNDSTGQSPAFLNLSREPQLPLDLILDDPTEGPPVPPDKIKHVTLSYRDRLSQDLKYAHYIAKEHSEVQKINQNNYYDRHTTQRNYAEGQLVWVAIPPGLMPEKLTPKWQGPCKILRQISPSSFKVQRLSDGVILGTVNSDRLKPYYELKTTSTAEDNLKPPASLMSLPLTPVITKQNIIPPEPLLRRTSRVRRPTTRYNND